MGVRRASAFTRWTVAAIVVCSLALGHGSAYAGPINGISDQNMAPAPGAHGGWDAAADNTYALLGLPYARYITSWDVVSHKYDNPCSTPCSRYWELANWINQAQAAGKRVLISFGDKVGCNYTCALPQPWEYAGGIQAFLLEFPSVREYTAWNEPNYVPSQYGGGNRLGAYQAADFWRTLNQSCQAQTGNQCTVAAGDLNESGDYRGYTTQYKSALTSLGAPAPPVWAIHPYQAVENMGANNTTARLYDWIGNYVPSGRPVWFSEVGAYKCSNSSGELGLTHQNQRAAYLKALTEGIAQVQRTYYYFLAKPDGGQEACPGFDTALIGLGDSERPALHTLFPGLRANQETVAAHASGSSWSLRDASTTYHWIYYVGTDGQLRHWSWNASTWANGQLGAGVAAAANTVPATMRDVASGKQWAYYIGSDRQIHVWHYNGSSWANYHLVAAGAEAALNTRPSVLRDPVSTNEWVYYVGSDGQIRHWSYNGAAWGTGTLGAGGAAAPNSSPVALRDTGTSRQWVYYFDTGRQIRSWYWNGSAWSNHQLIGTPAAQNTSPAVILDPKGSEQWIYYVGSDRRIWQWYYNGASWSNGVLPTGQLATSNTSPAVVRDPVSLQQWVYYVGADRQIWSWSWVGSWINGQLNGTQVAQNVSPTVMRDAYGQQWLYYVGADHQIWQWYWGGSWANGGLSGAPAADISLPPPTPTGFTGSGQDRTTIMYWDAVPGANGYRVYKQASNGTWSARFDVTTTAVFEPGLTNCTTYRYRVVAYNNAGESEPSQTLELTPRAPGQQC